MVQATIDNNNNPTKMVAKYARVGDSRDLTAKIVNDKWEYAYNQRLASANNKAGYRIYDVKVVNENEKWNYANQDEKLTGPLPSDNIPKSVPSYIYENPQGNYDIKEFSHPARYIKFTVLKYSGHPSMRADVYVDGKLQNTPENKRYYSSVWANNAV